MRRTSLCLLSIVGTALLSRSLSASAASLDHSADCIQKLRVIYQAIRSYRQDHRKLPDQLSDLIPKYLPNKDALHCPDNDDSSYIGYANAHKDPQIPISYSYEMSADRSMGVFAYPGPTPHNDNNQGWGTCRQCNEWLQGFYGDAVPMVRCYNHRRFSEPNPHDDILNLTEKGAIYRSGMQWEAGETGCLGLASCLQRGLNKGVSFFNRNWFLAGIDQRISSYLTISIWDGQTFSPPVRAHLMTVAHTLEQNAPKLRTSSMAYRIAARFAAAAGDKTDAIRLANRSRAMETNKRNEDTAILLTHLYESDGQYAKALALIRQMLAKRPSHRFYMDMLADAYEQMGNNAEAALWRRRANPSMPSLVGRQGADLAIKTLTGQGSLKEVRQGKKALILTFWFVGCPPCREELPHLQKIYQEYHDKGLEILAINPVDRPEAIRSFVAHGEFTFLFGKVQTSGNPHEDLMRQYRVDACPTCYLLDANGKVVWGSVGYGNDTERNLREALAKLGFTPEGGGSNNVPHSP